MGVAAVAMAIRTTHAMKLAGSANDSSSTVPANS